MLCIICIHGPTLTRRRTASATSVRNALPHRRTRNLSSRCQHNLLHDCASLSHFVVPLPCTTARACTITLVTTRACSFARTRPHLRHIDIGTARDPAIACTHTVRDARWHTHFPLCPYLIVLSFVRVPFVRLRALWHTTPRIAALSSCARAIVYLLGTVHNVACRDWDGTIRHNTWLN